ncbi:hypothetical protein [Maritimibacter dapengensis]|uniref:STAS domain-containing protein n=1 Tax=Maritimibacter dapengensis TaxID=2836868 RepID=A0ABS6T1Y3_9RHOB|nr:hypothetical protein [Maritimibacter dapengensis]MBV7379258.1 hypothetical protein [Maritimibacter dapengensis]
MTIHLHRVEGTEATLVRCENVVTFDDMVMRVNEFVQDVARTGHNTVVVDLTPTIDIDLSFRDVQDFIPYMRLALSDRDRSFRFELAAPPGTKSALARVFQLLSQGLPKIDVNVHRRLADAIEASGLGDDMADLAAN